MSELIKLIENKDYVKAKAALVEALNAKAKEKLQEMKKMVAVRYSEGPGVKD